MATVTGDARPRANPLAPDGFERALAVLAAVLLACVVAAVIKGQADWPKIPAIVWLHLATIVIALALTPVMMLRRRGDRLHRRLGWGWCAAMFASALVSFGIRGDDGSFSWIHILSVVVIVSVPLLIWHARAHRVDNHRRTVRGLTFGALLIAGFFTFPFDRLLGHWLFG